MNGMMSKLSSSYPSPKDMWSILPNDVQQIPCLNGSFGRVVARNSEVLGSNPGRVVHKQFFKLFEGMECAALCIELCTIKNR